MAELYFRNTDEGGSGPVTDQHPLPVHVYGQDAQPLNYGNFESITVSSASLPLTAAEADAFDHAVITVETDSVRFRMDGNAPTASVGHKLDPGDTLVLDGRMELDKARFIRVTTDATIRVSYGSRV